MADSNIDWTDKVWNPTTGCTMGCSYCYAEKMAYRLQRMGKDKYFAGFTPACHPDELRKPLHWKKPARIFVNSMGDLFDPAIPFDFIDQVMVIINHCSQHTFQILTKQPERMQEYMRSRLHGDYMTVEVAAGVPTLNDTWRIKSFTTLSPLNNLWLGVTVENQAAADSRIPILIKTPAEVRFVSIEPMTGPVRMNQINGKSEGWATVIDWVICGGQTGHNATPIHPTWVRILRNECIAQNVPFFFKSWGEKQDGHLVDDQEWRQFPW